MVATAISISISGLSSLIAFFALMRLFKNDNKGETMDLTRIETKVDYVGNDVKEVRDDIKAQGVIQSKMAERLATVEDSVKSAHHRIDGLEEKIK